MSAVQITPTQFAPGDTVLLENTFTTYDNQPLDPTTIALKVKRPDGTVDEYDKNDTTRVQAGVYTLNYLTTTEGRYYVRWETTGIPVTVDEGYFDVAYSVFV